MAFSVKIILVILILLPVCFAVLEIRVQRRRKYAFRPDKISGNDDSSFPRIYVRPAARELDYGRLKQKGCDGAYHIDHRLG